MNLGKLKSESILIDYISSQKKNRSKYDAECVKQNNCHSKS